MKGMHALQARLQGLSDLAARSANQGGREAAGQAAAYARQVVPVRTGRLKASIAPIEEKDRAAVAVRCPYAFYVERGTRFMSARPYLLPGVHQADYFSRVARIWKESMK